MSDRDAVAGGTCSAPENCLGEDLLRSIEEPSWTERAKGVERLAALYCADAFGSADRRAAEDVFRVLRFDGEALVRRVLSECLKNARQLPHDIALRIATDSAEIAAPFLEHSPVLEDRDLARIIAENPGEHRRAIARRRELSADAAAALRRCGDLEPTLHSPDKAA